MPLNPFCSVEGCERASETSIGYCVMHYKRWKRNRTTETVLRKYPSNFRCEFCGEYSSKFYKGLCKPCSIRKYRKGTPARSIRRKGEGSYNKDGYHVVTVLGDREYKHRIIAKAKLGEIVHHRNEQKADNDPNNLQKFGSQSEHMKEHYRMRKTDTMKKGDD